MRIAVEEGETLCPTCKIIMEHEQFTLDSSKRRQEKWEQDRAEIHALEVKRAKRRARWAWAENFNGQWIILAWFLFLIAFWFVQPYFEMRTFNRFTTGEKATYADALFANLRIESDQ